MKILVTAIVALLLIDGAKAAPAPLRPDDFAVGIPIEHDAGLPYFVVELPEVVYRTAVDPALADLRFFDADGRALQYGLVAPVVTGGRPEPALGAPATVALPLFALTREFASNALEAHVRIAEDGRLVSFTQASPPVASETYAWLIDASAVLNTAARFLVEVAPGANVFVGYTVDGSHDLHDWSNVVGAGTLVRVEQDGQTLRRAAFSITPRRFPYLRLRWQDPAAAPALAAVHAELLSADPPQNLRSLRLSGTRVVDQPREIRFDSGGYFPVSAAMLVLEPNRVLGGHLEAGSGGPVHWRPVAASEWYALTVDDNVMRSGPRPLPVQRARHWRFVADAGHGLDTGPLPELEIQYVPQAYRVLAEGRAPYLLAIGSGRAAVTSPGMDTRLSLSPVADMARFSAPARLGVEFELGGAARLAPPKSALPWQRIALWAVLGAGVLLIAAMVWRLRRDLDAAGDRR